MPVVYQNSWVQSFRLAMIHCPGFPAVQLLTWASGRWLNVVQYTLCRFSMEKIRSTLTSLPFRENVRQPLILKTFSAKTYDTFPSTDLEFSWHSGHHGHTPNCPHVAVHLHVPSKHIKKTKASQSRPARLCHRRREQCKAFVVACHDWHSHSPLTTRATTVSFDQFVRLCDPRVRDVWQGFSPADSKQIEWKLGF